MLLLLTAALLLIFITLNLGILARELFNRLFRTTLHPDLLELFLLGLLLSSIYFELLSFWLPVNYWTLLPPGLLAAGAVFRRKDKPVWQSIQNNLRLFFSAHHRLVTAIVGLVLLTYWILPCGSPDSIIYHFQSIAWFEKYKVVPGLANLNGRLAFNPASFIIESAYSFSGPVGQHLYPLNGVVAAFLFSWLLLRVFKAENALISLLYAVLTILVFRHTLIDVTSPSSDGLSITCTVYVLVRTAEYSLSKNRCRAQTVIPVLVILYGITVKPATFALLLALPYLFFTLEKTQRTAGLILRTTLISLLICLPWLARNYILSGYLIFPFSLTGIFHPDWQVPFDAVKMEFFYFNVIPKFDDDWSAAAVARAHTLFGWVLPWFRRSVGSRFVDILCLMLALLSPLYWFIRLFFKKDRLALLPIWTIAFLATLAWMLAAPVFRFGSTYVYITFMLPAFDLVYLLSGSSGGTAQPLGSLARYAPAFILLAFTCTSAYYIYTGVTRETTYRFSIADCWLRPLKAWMYNHRQKADFPYRILKNGTKLYMADSTHECINTCLPCAEFNYGRVEMRGTRLDQGFRNISDEVRLHYPAFVQ